MQLQKLHRSSCRIGRSWGRGNFITIKGRMFAEREDMNNNTTYFLHCNFCVVFSLLLCYKQHNNTTTYFLLSTFYFLLCYFLLCYHQFIERSLHPFQAFEPIPQLLDFLLELVNFKLLLRCCPYRRTIILLTINPYFHSKH